VTGTCRPSARIAMTEKRRSRSDCPIWREGSFRGRNVPGLYTVSDAPVQRAPWSPSRWSRWSGPLQQGHGAFQGGGRGRRHARIRPTRRPGPEIPDHVVERSTILAGSVVLPDCGGPPNASDRSMVRPDRRPRGPESVPARPCGKVRSRSRPSNRATERSVGEGHVRTVGGCRRHAWPARRSSGAGANGPETCDARSRRTSVALGRTRV
jgi:hypothetical protein